MPRLPSHESDDSYPVAVMHEVYHSLFVGFWSCFVLYLLFIFLTMVSHLTNLQSLHIEAAEILRSGVLSA